LVREVAEGNFTLLLGHLIGVDHAGHSYSAGHLEIERKLNDTEAVIKDIISFMDSNTTLIVFGDHGMTDDGNHGGGTANELRTVFFVYSKRPLLGHELLYDRALTDQMKQLDLASTISTILGLTLPFQNLGVPLAGLIPTESLT